MASSTHDFHPDGSLEVGRTVFGTVTLRAECGSTRLTTYLHARQAQDLLADLNELLRSEEVVTASQDRRVS